MLLYVHNVTDSLIDLYTGSIAADEKVLIDQETITTWSEDTVILNLILNESLVIYSDNIELEPIDGIKILMGNARISLDIARDENGRIKMSVTPEIHGETHGTNQTDEINVQGLSGILSDAQRPIPEDCVSAMGVKSNANSLNHDRFQQTEILNLPETQLQLNNPSHSNINDPTPNQKSALDANASLSSSNPVASIADLIPGVKGDNGKDFSITKTYVSITAMEADFDNMIENDFVLIDTGDVNDIDTGKLYYKGSISWNYIGDLSGASGIQGEPGKDGIDGQNGSSKQTLIVGYKGSITSSYKYMVQSYKYDTRYVPIYFTNNMKVTVIKISSRYKKDLSGDNYEICFMEDDWGSTSKLDDNNKIASQTIFTNDATRRSATGHMVDFTNISTIILDSNKQYSIAIRRVGGDKYIYYPLLTIELEEI